MKTSIASLLLFLSLMFLSIFLERILWNEWSFSSSCVYYFSSALFAGFVSIVFFHFERTNIRRGGILKVPLKHFREKIWMTIGLGSFFSCLYLFIYHMSYFLVDREVFLKQFFFGIEHPSYFFIWSLFIFLANALLVYLIRMFVKYFYHLRNS